MNKVKIIDRAREVYWATTWVEVDLEANEAANVVYNMCIEYNPEEWGSTGDVIEYELEEDMI